MSISFDLTGTTAVVTGAKRGIGFAMAEGLAAAGADIIGVSATIESTGSAIAAAVEAHGRSFEARAVDFADRAAVVALGDELRQRRVDILVNNAGTIERAPAAEHPLDLWDRVVEVNLSSQFVLTQAVAGGMLERGRGKIIFTASLLSFQGGINVPGYAAAKSGVAGLVKALSNEWTLEGRDGQRHRSRLHRDRQHPGAACRPRSFEGDPRPHPGRPLGRRRGHRRRDGLPRLSGGGLRLGRDPARRRRMARPMILTGQRFVPVIVLDDARQAVPLAEALLRGGIGCAEITLRTDAGPAAIAAASAVPDFIVGAGTVLTPDDVDRVVDAGARFVVSPGLAEDVVERSLELGVEVIPGVATATEVQRALRLGLSRLKLFPAGPLGGFGRGARPRRTLPRRAVPPERRSDRGERRRVPGLAVGVRGERQLDGDARADRGAATSRRSSG